ncbi:MAG: tRNA (N(6)-L-threonylcarbamoyladenosine(37)-C(2))-methylthiotransferase MtaB [Vulcanimicrobiota bacterium]
MPENPTFAIHTLGCRANQAESERMRDILVSAGFAEVAFGQPADCQVVNTCTVTREADRKSRQMIRRALRLSPTVVATGCAVADRGGVKNLPGTALRLPPERTEELLSLLGAERCPATELVERETLATRTRALLKVQDGCDQFCSFCIVPYVRGRSRSRPVAEVVEEARRLEQQGYQEIVLTGIHLSIWGHDLEGAPDLADLVEAILTATERPRIRLSSVEPDRFPARIFELMTQASGRLCPHLHLVLQHASDVVLERMRRGYTLAHYRGLVDEFFQRVPDACLTTDLMVGFPGETDQDFACLMDYVRQTPFYRVHVFPYSLRPGTTASKFSDQVEPAVKNHRRDRLLRLVEKKRVEFLRANYGRTARVLVETVERPGWVKGVSHNYLNVAFRGGPRLLGRTLDVRLERRRKDLLVGSLVGEDFPRPH